jgi:hypothetical protein
MVTAFDNIITEIISNTADSLVVKFSNTTPTDAIVSIMVENSTDGQKNSMGENYIKDLPTITLGSGEFKSITFKK